VRRRRKQGGGYGRSLPFLRPGQALPASFSVWSCYSIEEDTTWPAYACIVRLDDSTLGRKPSKILDRYCKRTAAARGIAYWNVLACEHC